MFEPQHTFDYSHKRSKECCDVARIFGLKVIGRYPNPSGVSYTRRLLIEQNLAKRPSVFIVVIFSFLQWFITSRPSVYDTLMVHYIATVTRSLAQPHCNTHEMTKYQPIYRFSVCMLFSTSLYVTYQCITMHGNRSSASRTSSHHLGSNRIRCLRHSHS